MTNKADTQPMVHLSQSHCLRP